MHVNENWISYIHSNIILLNTTECQDKLFIIMGHNRGVYFLPGNQIHL
jgi:hypothetical protein